MPISVNTVEAKKLMELTIRAGLVPMLTGSPGCGKSAIVMELAKDLNLKVIDIRLAQCDPTDLLGFPSIDKEKNKASYIPMDTFPLEGDEIPDGYDGWLVFLDELPSADRSTQKAAYRLLYDKQVGQRPLHSHVAMIGAGNLTTDNAMVEDMSTALQSRMIHFELELDPDVWIEWAMQKGIDHRITSFIKFMPKALYSFKPDHTDKTYSCGRTWEFADRFLKSLNITDPLMLPLLSGTVSEPISREFLGFTRIYEDLPTMQEIEKYPEAITVPTEPSVLFALTGQLALNASPGNVENRMKFINRIPAEFQVICLREIHQRDKSLTSHPAISEWYAKNSQQFF